MTIACFENKLSAVGRQGRLHDLVVAAGFSLRISRGDLQQTTRAKARGYRIEMEEKQ